MAPPGAASQLLPPLVLALAGAARGSFAVLSWPRVAVVPFGGSATINCSRSPCAGGDAGLSLDTPLVATPGPGGLLWQSFRLSNVSRWRPGDVTCAGSCGDSAATASSAIVVYQLPREVTLEPVPAVAVGDSHLLRCHVLEVAPVANLTVTLRRGAETLRTATFGDSEGSASVTVTHPLTVTRGDHGQRVTCHAELSLRPHGPLFARAAPPVTLSVFALPDPPLLHAPPILELGTSANVTCRVLGAFPVGDIRVTAALGGHPLRVATALSPGDTVTASAELWPPRTGEYELTCTAQVATVAKTARRKLRVYRFPEPRLEVRPVEVAAGEEVTVTCGVGDTPESRGDGSGLPGDSSGLPGDTQKIAGDTSESPGDTSESPGDTSGLLGDSPGLPGVTPESRGDSSGLPGDSQKLPGVTSGLLGDTSGLPGDSQKLPGDTSESPGDTSGLLGDSSGLPGDSQKLPGDTPKTAGDTSGLPGETSGLLGDTSGLLGDTLRLLRDTSGLPGDTSKPHGDTSRLPRDTSGLPGDTSGLPRHTPKPPGDTPGLPGDTPGLPGDTLGLPGDNFGLPGDNFGLPGDTLGLPGDTPGLPGSPRVRLQLRDARGALLAEGSEPRLQLRLLARRRDHGRQIVCGARLAVGDNEVTKEAAARLAVLYPPEFPPGSCPASRTWLRGSRRSLSCLATGNPSPTVSCGHRGVPVATTEPWVVTRALAGIYECKATNALGTRSRRVTVRVEREPTMSESGCPARRVWVEGQRWRLECGADGEPEPSTRCEREGGARGRGGQDGGGHGAIQDGGAHGDIQDGGAHSGIQDGGAHGDIQDGGGQDGGTHGAIQDGGGQDGGTHGGIQDGGGQGGGTHGDIQDGGTQDGRILGGIHHSDIQDGGTQVGGSHGDIQDGGTQDGRILGGIHHSDIQDGGTQDGGSHGGIQDGGTHGGIEDGGIHDDIKDGGTQDGGTHGDIQDGTQDGGTHGGIQDGGTHGDTQDGGIQDGGTHGGTHGITHGRTHGGIQDGGTHGGTRRGGTHGGIQDGRTHGGIQDGGTPGGTHGSIQDGGTRGVTNGITHGGTHGDSHGGTRGIQDGSTYGDTHGGIQDGGTYGGILGTQDGGTDGGTQHGGIQYGSTHGGTHGRTHGGTHSGIQDGGNQDGGAHAGIQDGGTHGGIQDSGNQDGGAHGGIQHGGNQNGGAHGGIQDGSNQNGSTHGRIQDGGNHNQNGGAHGGIQNGGNQNGGTHGGIQDGGNQNGGAHGGIQDGRVVTRADGGRYVCRATNRHGVATRSVLVTVEYPPGLPELGCPGRHRWLEGTPARLRCEATGNPPPVVTCARIADYRENHADYRDNHADYRDFYRDYRDYSRDYRDIHNATELGDGAANVTRGHAGTYECRASNAHGWASKNVSVAVEYPPSSVTLRVLPSPRVAPGADFSVWCGAGGVPRPRFRWALPPAPNARWARGNRSVLVTAASAANAGEYRCQVGNRHGRAEASVEVTITRGHRHGRAEASGEVTITRGRVSVPGGHRHGRAEASVEVTITHPWPLSPVSLVSLGLLVAALGLLVAAGCFLKSRAGTKGEYNVSEAEGSRGRGGDWGIPLGNT